MKHWCQAIRYKDLGTGLLRTVPRINSVRSGIIVSGAGNPLSAQQSLKRRHHYQEFARGKPRRTLSSQLSGKLTNSLFGAACVEAAFRCGDLAGRPLAADLVGRSASSCCLDEILIPFLLCRFWVGARSISAELRFDIKERYRLEADCLRIGTGS